GEISPISFIADLPRLFLSLVVPIALARQGNKRTSRKYLRNNRYCIYLEQQLWSRQSDHLDHGAGWKIGSQEFSSRFVYVAVITDVGGKYVHRDYVVHCSTGSLHGSLNLLDYILRLSTSIWDANHITLRI